VLWVLAAVLPSFAMRDCPGLHHLPAPVRAPAMVEALVWAWSPLSPRNLWSNRGATWVVLAAQLGLLESELAPCDRKPAQPVADGQLGGWAEAARLDDGLALLMLLALLLYRFRTLWRESVVMMCW